MSFCCLVTYNFFLYFTKERTHLRVSSYNVFWFFVEKRLDVFENETNCTRISVNKIKKTSNLYQKSKTRIEIIKKENKNEKTSQSNSVCSPYSPCHHPCGSEHVREEKKNYLFVLLTMINSTASLPVNAIVCNRINIKLNYL